MSAPGAARGIRRVPAAAGQVVLVCRKCSKKLGGGFGPDGDERLAKVLRRTGGGKAKPRKAPLVVLEVGCLDLCPKGAVVVLRGDRPDDWLVVGAGTPAEAVGRALDLPPVPPRKEA